MGWLSTISQIAQIIGLLLSWWKETNNQISKDKLDALKKVLDAAQQDDQEAMKNAINAFNSI